MKIKDLTDQKFGRLTAIRPTEQRESKSVVWECLCDCGNTAFVSARNLKNGNTQSCGCLQKERSGAKKAKDLTGQQFGRLTAIRPTEERKRSYIVWECTCACDGKTVFVDAGSLLGGNTKSCGCLRSRKEL